MRDDRIVHNRGFPFVRLKSGRLLSFWDAHTATESAHTALARSVSRAFKLAVATEDAESREYNLDRLDWLLREIGDYVTHVRKLIEGEREKMSKHDRIARLRNVTGRTPEEAAEFLAKAEELERRVGR